MTYYDAAKKVLEQSDVPMKADEIWQKAIELGYDKIIAETLNGKMSKTPIASLGAVIYTNIKYNPDTTIFIKVGRGKFFLKSKINSSNQNLINENAANDDTEDIIESTNKKILEEDLHTPLTKYLYSMKIYSKTINANATDVNLKGKMKWGTPDIVGVTFKDYINKSVLELFNHINLPTTEIYAYELKLKITLGSLTEYYFQALSNSGWANEAWLAAMEIDENNYDELMEEMKRLNQSFGVGIMKLNYDNPEDSEILFSAQKRNYLDIDTMHKLCYNRQFQDFINDINEIFNNMGAKNHIISSFINNGRFNNPN